MNYCVTTSPRSRKAFTIIELLAVIAIIGVLAAIAFGVSRGVNERSQKSRAESDLMLLAQHLEEFKAEYGDYPRVKFSDSDAAASGNRQEGEQATIRLYNALNGMRSMQGDADGPQPKLNKFNIADRQKGFIDRSKFNFEYSPSQNPPDPVPNPETDEVALLDPWGNVYRYFYDPEPTSWENKTYVLYSVGPDGEHFPPNAKGYPDYDREENLDNIYANRN